MLFLIFGACNFVLSPFCRDPTNFPCVGQILVYLMLLTDGEEKRESIPSSVYRCQTVTIKFNNEVVVVTYLCTPAWKCIALLSG